MKIKLSKTAINPDHIFYFDLIQSIDLSQKKSVIEVLRVGTVFDRGFVVTSEMIDDYIQNFESGVVGSKLQIDLRHDREGEAAAWVERLYREGDKLLAEVEWTPLGEEKVSQKLYRYTSSELAPEYKHWQTGKPVKNVFIGAALTNIPAVKGMAPVSLSEQANLFFNSQNMDKLKKMHAGLSAKKSITAEEFAEFKKEAADHGDEGKKMMSELEKKVGGGEDTPPEKKEKPPVKASEEKGETVSLSEFNTMQEKIKKQDEQLAEERAERIKLQETILRKDLSEQIDANLLHSQTRKWGFHKKESDRLSNFLINLNGDQRKEFFSLFAEAKYVDLSVIGGDGEEKNGEDEKVDEAQKKAEKLSEETGKPLHECLSEVYRTLEEAKKK